MDFFPFLCPFERAIDGFANFIFGGGRWGAFVKAHDDVAPEFMLNVHSLSRSDKKGRTIDVGSKVDTMFLYGELMTEGEDLKSSGVREDGLWPINELMQASCLLDRLFSRLKVEMIGITEEDLCAELQEMVVRETSHSSRGSYRHEEGGLNGTVGSGECSTTADGCFFMKSKHLCDGEYRGTSTCEIS